MYKLQLKELRKKAGFKTQEDIADYLGMKLRKYQTWERGEVALTLEDAYMLCVALKCTPNDLCGWPKGLNDDSEPLTSEEMEIVDCYRESSPQWQQNIAMTARAAAGESKKKAEHHIPAAAVRSA
jgi:transcriptional regulator with XRE-family HTH domain